MVTIENLTTGYGKHLVFRNVTLRFEGGVAGLVGPNGAGKTTLLRTLLGFLPFKEGRVEVCGCVLPRQARLLRAKVGYMPEGEALISEMTAVEFVAYMGQLSGLPRQAAIERAHSVLQYVGLEEARYRNLETYSAGMKQRVKLAQAIVHDPELLLLDEPTDGMDPTGRREMLDLLRDLGHNKGINIIICSHLLDDVEYVASEIILINEGRILSRKLTKSAVQDEAVFLVRVRGNMEAFVRSLRERGGRLLAPPEGATLRLVLASPQESQLVFAAAEESDCTVMRFEPETEKAADVFIELLEETQNAHL